MSSLLATARGAYHAALLRGVLASNQHGVPSNADKDSRVSVDIARGILARLGGASGERLAGQMAGNQFEDVTWSFLDATFRRLDRLRPGLWDVVRVTARGGRTPVLASYEQYAHLAGIRDATRLLTRESPKLAASIAVDYTISPDIIIARHAESDERINADAALVDAGVATRASLRKSAESPPLLHASISCKWTLRSDRAQNARTEALNLMRHRKGRAPHIVVVTGEPLPSRLASLALGTGDVDCVYHFALDEFRESVEASVNEEQRELLATMVDGKRLKDIADLPLDLAV